MRKENYLKQVYATSKLLFVGIVAFILLNLAANLIFKAEHTPIYRWDMYSQRISPQKIYSFLEVKYNNGVSLRFSGTWQEPVKLFFTNTLNHFIAMKRGNNEDPLKHYIDSWSRKYTLFASSLPGLKLYNDSIEMNQFSQWYKRYLEQHLKIPVYRIDVYEVQVAYKENGELKSLSSHLICHLL